jgi:hypothetical protein
MPSPALTILPEKFGRRQVVLVLGALSVLIVIGAYFRMLTDFAQYDDEGSMMISVKQYIGGMRLYEDISSHYGPVYYLYNWLLRTFTATPVTHDITRLSSLIPWIGSAALCALVALRVTNSLVVSATCMTVVSQATNFFAREPGHPQELVLLLVTVLVACPLLVDYRRWNRGVPFFLGAIAAALLLVKVNIGLYMFAALALTFATQLPPGALNRALAWGTAAGCLLLPPVLMHAHLNVAPLQEFCAVVTFSIAAAVVCLFTIRMPSDFPIRNCLMALAGFLAIIAFLLAVLRAQGITPGVIVDSLVLIPARVYTFRQATFYVPFTSPAWAVLGLTGFALAVLVAARRTALGGREWKPLFAIKAILSVAAVVAILLRVNPVPVLTPFVWLVLYHPDEEQTKTQSFPRSLLCTVTILHTLYAYPLMGSQGLLLRHLLFTVVLVCVADSINWLTNFGAAPAWYVQHGRLFAKTVLVVLVLFNAGLVFKYRYDYAARPSLDLPGAKLVHVTPEVKEGFHGVVKAIQQSCDAFETLPGMPSLHFWTGQEPLTGLNDDAWILIYTQEQQSVLIGALARHRNACVVYNPVLEAFWNRNKENLDTLPMVHYIWQEFKPVMVSNGYQLLIRKERSWNVKGM